VTDEQLLAGAMLLPHHHVEQPLPFAVATAELAVLVPLGRARAVLEPEQLEGDVFAP